MTEKFQVFTSLISERWFTQMRDLPVEEDLLKILRGPSAKITEAEFKWYLADAILNKRYSVEEYERLTDLDFETRDEVAADLAELWHLMFKGAPITTPTQSS